MFICVQIGYGFSQYTFILFIICEVWQAKVRYGHSTTPLSIQQEYSVLISPQHISEVAPSITFYLNYRGKEIGDTSEK